MNKKREKWAPAFILGVFYFFFLWALNIVMMLDIDWDKCWTYLAFLLTMFTKWYMLCVFQKLNLYAEFAGKVIPATQVIGTDMYQVTTLATVILHQHLDTCVHALTLYVLNFLEGT